MRYHRVAAQYRGVHTGEHISLLGMRRADPLAIGVVRSLVECEWCIIADIEITGILHHRIRGQYMQRQVVRRVAQLLRHPGCVVMVRAGRMAFVRAFLPSKRIVRADGDGLLIGINRIHMQVKGPDTVAAMNSLQTVMVHIISRTCNGDGYRIVRRAGGVGPCVCRLDDILADGVVLRVVERRMNRKTQVLQIRTLAGYSDFLADIVRTGQRVSGHDIMQLRTEVEWLIILAEDGIQILRGVGYDDQAQLHHAIATGYRLQRVAVGATDAELHRQSMLILVTRPDIRKVGLTGSVLFHQDALAYVRRPYGQRQPENRVTAGRCSRAGRAIGGVQMVNIYKPTRFSGRERHGVAGFVRQAVSLVVQPCEGFILTDDGVLCLIERFMHIERQVINTIATGYRCICRRIVVLPVCIGALRNGGSRLGFVTRDKQILPADGVAVADMQRVVVTIGRMHR